MPQRKLIDLGWAMARLEMTQLEEGKRAPQLTICWPAGEESADRGWLELWDFDGLHNLRDALAEFLDQLDEEMQDEQATSTGFD